MKFGSIYSGMSDKVKSVIFAKKIAEAEAEIEAARKKTVLVVCICAGIAIVAAAMAVGVYFLLKQEAVKAKISATVEKIKSKLPCKKAECEECEAVEEAAEEAAE